MTAYKVLSVLRTLHDSHVSIYHREAVHAGMVRSWREAQTQEQRHAMGLELMRRAAHGLSYGAPMPAALQGWVAERLRAAADSGGADVAFGLTAGRGRPTRIPLKRLNYAAALHAACDLTGSDAEPAARALYALFHVEASAITKALRRARQDWEIAGPFRFTPPSADGTLDWEVHRGAVLTLGEVTDTAPVTVEFTRREAPHDRIALPLPYGLLARLRTWPPRRR